MYPWDTLDAFDLLLRDRGLRLDGVVIGGAALNLLGVISRNTEDMDLLEPILDLPLREAARDLAIQVRERGGDLDDEWLNNGPASLGDDLPAGWQQRVRVVFRGAAIELHTLGRADLLKTKVFALCDRGIDLLDCVAMRPTPEELAELLPWLEARDIHPGWPLHVRTTVAGLARRLGHAA